MPAATEVGSILNMCVVILCMPQEEAVESVGVHSSSIDPFARECAFHT